MVLSHEAFEEFILREVIVAAHIGTHRSTMLCSQPTSADAELSAELEHYFGKLPRPSKTSKQLCRKVRETDTGAVGLLSVLLSNEFI